jgi:hypothetical protein
VRFSRCSGLGLSVACAILLLVGVIPASAEGSSNFSGLEKHVHKKVTVETTTGQHITGELVRVEQNRLVIYESGTPQTIARQSVKRVTRHKSRHTAAWIAGMAGAGLAAGFLIGLREYDDAVNSNQKVTLAGIAGAGAGAATGFGISRIGKAEEVVYQAEEPSSAPTPTGD